MFEHRVQEFSVWFVCDFSKAIYTRRNPAKLSTIPELLKMLVADTRVVFEGLELVGVVRSDSEQRALKPRLNKVLDELTLYWCLSCLISAQGGVLRMKLQKCCRARPPM